jgi:hypothetical protein
MISTVREAKRSSTNPSSGYQAYRLWTSHRRHYSCSTKTGSYFILFFTSTWRTLARWLQWDFFHHASHGTHVYIFAWNAPCYDRNHVCILICGIKICTVAITHQRCTCLLDICFIRHWITQHGHVNGAYTWDMPLHLQHSGTSCSIIC